MDESIIDVSKTPTEAWEQIAKSNEELQYWTDAYLKHSMNSDKNGWYVYRGRWRGYVKEKRHPYYDTVRLFYWKQHAVQRRNKELQERDQLIEILMKRINSMAPYVEKYKNKLEKEVVQS